MKKICFVMTDFIIYHMSYYILTQKRNDTYFFFFQISYPLFENSVRSGDLYCFSFIFSTFVSMFESDYIAVVATCILTAAIYICKFSIVLLFISTALQLPQ